MPIAVPESASTPGPTPASAPRRPKRVKSASEEVANQATHAVGVVLSLAALVALSVVASRSGDPVAIASYVAFGVTLVLLYGASVLYHSSRTERRRHLFKVLDHCAIYLLIAGTYTPFMAVNLRGPLGVRMLATIWALAGAGVLFKLFFVHRFRVLSTGVYLAMGWLVVFVMGPVVASLPATGLTWLVAGGLSYSAGVIFYLWDSLRFNHAVWHVFVLGGSLCHVVSVLSSGSVAP